MTVAAEPTLRIERFDLGPAAADLADAREELLARVEPEPGGDHRWGYLLGVEGRPGAASPAVERVVAALEERVLLAAAAGSERRYELSFLKTLVGTPPEAAEGVHYEGFHLDTHPQITADEGVELARVLVNLAPSARALRYAVTDRFELARKGVVVPRSDYQVVRLPAEVEVRTIEIPAQRGTVVSGLRFWASVVPHVGEERGDGHFLASYEALAPYEPKRP